MHFLLALVHFVGPKPLTASLVAQIVVLGVSLKLKDKNTPARVLSPAGRPHLCHCQHRLRTPSPPDRKSDILGTIAAVLFLDPGVQALIKLRKKPAPGQKH